jgi:hypothetical protein
MAIVPCFAIIETRRNTNFWGIANYFYRKKRKK